MVELTIKKRHAIKKSQLASLMQKLTDTIGSDAALYNAPMIEIAETASKFNIYIIDKNRLSWNRTLGHSRHFGVLSFVPSPVIGSLWIWAQFPT